MHIPGDARAWGERPLPALRRGQFGHGGGIWWVGEGLVYTTVHCLLLPAQRWRGLEAAPGLELVQCSRAGSWAGGLCPEHCPMSPSPWARWCWASAPARVSSALLPGAADPLPWLGGAEWIPSCPQRAAEGPGQAPLCHLALHIRWARALRGTLDRGRHQ